MQATWRMFETLTAADIMTRELVTIPRYLSLRAAARLLEQHHITGAPVVDDEGLCIGVLSATDFIHWARTDASEPRLPSRSDVCADWQMVEMDVLPLEAVGLYMTAAPITAAPDTSVTDLARLMLEAHVHRIVIIDEQNHPLGIVSTIDILRAVAGAEPGV